MAKIDKTYHNILNTILTKGFEYIDENSDVKRLQVPFISFEHLAEDGFPAITTKKVFWKSIAAELIWFLRGDNDIKYLVDNGVNIWTKDAYNYYLQLAKGVYKGEELLNFEEFKKKKTGTVGYNYSRLWRNFNGIDQIRNLIYGMRENIMSTRLIVTAWDPASLHSTALPPCHNMFQILGEPLGKGKFGFYLSWNQRSVDTFLGLPFNIASYALLASILERLTGHKYLGLIGNLHNVHLYDNQLAGAREVLKRDYDKFDKCFIEISDKIKEPDFKNYNIEDFNLILSGTYNAINVEMIERKR